MFIAMNRMFIDICVMWIWIEAPKPHLRHFRFAAGTCLFVGKQRVFLHICIRLFLLIWSTINSLR